MRFEHRAALEYLENNNVASISCRAVEQALVRQDYTVVEYSKMENQPDVETLLNALGLIDFSRTVRAFCYKSGEIRAVFIEEGLTPDERLTLLLHEQGHICCDDYFGDEEHSDIHCEQSAAEFARFLLSENLLVRLTLFKVRRGKKALAAVIAAAAAVLVLAVGAAAAAGISAQNKKAESVPERTSVSAASEDTLYCVTEHGGKYHMPGCPYVKNKDAEKITENECLARGLEPCKYCIGE